MYIFIKIQTTEYISEFSQDYYLVLRAHHSRHKSIGASFLPARRLTKIFSDNRLRQKSNMDCIINIHQKERPLIRTRKPNSLFRLVESTEQFSARATDRKQKSCE
jgi:hypothetical protein